MIDIFDLKKEELEKFFFDKGFEPKELDEEIFEDFKFIGNPGANLYIYRLKDNL